MGEAFNVNELISIFKKIQKDGYSYVNIEKIEVEEDEKEYFEENLANGFINIEAIDDYGYTGIDYGAIGIVTEEEIEKNAKRNKK